MKESKFDLLEFAKESFTFTEDVGRFIARYKKCILTDAHIISMLLSWLAMWVESREEAGKSSEFTMLAKKFLAETRQNPNYFGNIN